MFTRDFTDESVSHCQSSADLLDQVLDTIILSVNDPFMSLASIQNEIEKLKPAERAALIDVLWESLDEARIKEIEAKWAAESEDRIDAFERGELPAVDGPTALREIRSSLTK